LLNNINDYIDVSKNDIDGGDNSGNVPQTKTELYSNYPNPFNPETKISFNLGKDSYVHLDIYNIKGQKVNSLLRDKLSKGRHEVVWNGLSSSNLSAASGVYFYRLKTNDKVLTKKMMLLK